MVKFRDSKNIFVRSFKLGAYFKGVPQNYFHKASHYVSAVTYATKSINKLGLSCANLITALDYAAAANNTQLCLFN